MTKTSRQRTVNHTGLLGRATARRSRKEGSHVDPLAYKPLNFTGQVQVSLPTSFIALHWYSPVS